MTNRTSLEAWQALCGLRDSDGAAHLRDLFAADPARFDRFSGAAAGLFVDYSKTRITKAIRDGLFSLARACDLEGRRAAMFAGEKINTTENRSVLHVALRDTAHGKYCVDGVDVMPKIESVLEQMKDFCGRIHSGTHRGFSGEPLDTVVNIGIGGSDLGPVMVTEALKPYSVEGRRTFYVSNVDGTHLAETLKEINPERTLFVIASKTFTTQETMTNAASARSWFLENGGRQEDIARHFVALSTNAEAVAEFGVDTDNMFQFWDWVGGRYSLWSAIGLSIALQLGFDNFRQLLDGAAAMDRHFENAPLEENLPALLGLVDVWHRSFLGMAGHAVLPYDQYMHRLPAYLQQADMESNGKRVAMDGTAVSYPTGPLLFGEPGTNGQHAFYQLIHQGTDIVPCDFIAPAHSHNPMGDHHEKLLANFIAQPEALMVGKSEAEVRAELAATGMASSAVDALAPHKVFPGNRPSVSILMDRVDPKTLGALIALYEHRIFTQSVIWGINAFDQWGVELGKVLAQRILPELSGAPDASADTSHDSSTAGIIDWLRHQRGH